MHLITVTAKHFMERGPCEGAALPPAVPGPFAAAVVHGLTLDVEVSVGELSVRVHVRTISIAL